MNQAQSSFIVYSEYGKEAKLNDYLLLRFHKVVNIGTSHGIEIFGEGRLGLAELHVFSIDHLVKV